MTGTTDALRRLQTLRPTRTGSIPAVLAQVQGDLQTVIEAVLELAAENTPPASQNGPQEARSADSGTGGPPEPENGAEAHSAFPLFVAPDGFDNPTIWWGEREVLLRTDANADAFDALADLVRTAQGDA